MIPDRLQDFLDDFWNFENFTKSRPSDPVLLIDYLAYLETDRQGSLFIFPLGNVKMMNQIV